MAIGLIALSQFYLRLLSHVAPQDIAGLAAHPRLTEARAQHIIYGDAHGGGHLHGLGKPCKSEFPADWSAQTITSTVIKDAADSALNWRREKNGNYVAETEDQGVKIRIVLNGQRTEIVTAYPLNTPRNPCPAANDNND